VTPPPCLAQPATGPDAERPLIAQLTFAREMAANGLLARGDDDRDTWLR
jgi:hypothetical protein